MLMLVLVNLNYFLNSFVTFNGMSYFVSDTVPIFLSQNGVESSTNSVTALLFSNNVSQDSGDHSSNIIKWNRDHPNFSTQDCSEFPENADNPVMVREGNIHKEHHELQLSLLSEQTHIEKEDCDFIQDKTDGCIFVKDNNAFEEDKYQDSDTMLGMTLSNVWKDHNEEEYCNSSSKQIVTYHTEVDCPLIEDE